MNGWGAHVWNSQSPAEACLEVTVLPVELILLRFFIEDPLRCFDVVSVGERHLVLLNALQNCVHLGC
jgi:hypothetical protein